LKMHDVQISFIADDFRPPFIFNDVMGADLHDIQAQKAAGVSTFVLEHVQNINLRQVKGVKDVTVENFAKEEL